MKISTVILFTVLITKVSGLSQGFVNLNFEQAKNPETFYATNAIPGWTAYINGNPQTYIIYNDVSLGAAAVSIHDTNDFFPPIQK